MSRHTAEIRIDWWRSCTTTADTTSGMQRGWWELGKGSGWKGLRDNPEHFDQPTPTPLLLSFPAPISALPCAPSSLPYPKSCNRSLQCWKSCISDVENGFAGPWKVAWLIGLSDLVISCHAATVLQLLTAWSCHPLPSWPNRLAVKQTLSRIRTVADLIISPPPASNVWLVWTSQLGLVELWPQH